MTVRRKERERESKGNEKEVRWEGMMVMYIPPI